MSEPGGSRSIAGSQAPWLPGGSSGTPRLEVPCVIDTKSMCDDAESPTLEVRCSSIPAPVRKTMGCGNVHSIRAHDSRIKLREQRWAPMRPAGAVASELAGALAGPRNCAASNPYLPLAWQAQRARRRPLCLPRGQSAESRVSTSRAGLFHDRGGLVFPELGPQRAEHRYDDLRLDTGLVQQRILSEI